MFLLRNEYSIPTGELIIGNIAAIAAHKDYFTFVDVAEIVLSKKIAATFFIVGDGPDRKEIEQYVNAKKLADKILFTRLRKDVPKFYRSSTSYFLPQKRKDWALHY